MLLQMLFQPGRLGGQLATLVQHPAGARGDFDPDKLLQIWRRQQPPWVPRDCLLPLLLPGAARSWCLWRWRWPCLSLASRCRLPWQQLPVEAEQQERRDQCQLCLRKRPAWTPILAAPKRQPRDAVHSHNRGVRSGAASQLNPLPAASVVQSKGQVEAEGRPQSTDWTQLMLQGEASQASTTATKSCTALQHVAQSAVVPERSPVGVIGVGARLEEAGVLVALIRRYCDHITLQTWGKGTAGRRGVPQGRQHIETALKPCHSA
jgi:hypothetical protein